MEQLRGLLAAGWGTWPSVRRLLTRRTSRWWYVTRNVSPAPLLRFSSHHPCHPPPQSRGLRYEEEQAIKPWTYDRPEHIVQLSKSEWRRYPLEIKKPNGKTGMILRFQLPSVHGRMGVDVASCILLRYRDATTGEYVVRPYTPISMDWDFGHVDLCVKRYPDGKMGNHLHNLAVGESVEIKGPFPSIVIEPNAYPTIGLIGGGSGITPLWQVCCNSFFVRRSAMGGNQYTNTHFPKTTQVMMYLAKHPHNRTNCSLVYANNKYDDIMMESVCKLMKPTCHSAPHLS